MQCLNGHEITGNETFCTVCGARRIENGSFASLPTPGAAGPSGMPITTPSGSAFKKPAVLIPSITGAVILVVVLALLFIGGNQRITVETTQFHYGCGELTSSDSVWPGADVIVKGPNGKVVGSGAYSHGVNGHDYDSTHHWVKTCTFTTSFDVKSNLSTYKIVVGGGNGVTFQLNELRNNQWTAQISVGYRDNPVGSYNDGYTWGSNNAYYSSDCDWWSHGPANDDQYQWEAGCRAGYYANPY
jgi:hypothetical protein